VTVKAPSLELWSNSDVLSSSGTLINLTCVVDQNGTMGGKKIDLLKERSIYRIEQLNQ